MKNSVIEFAEMRYQKASISPKPGASVCGNLCGTPLCGSARCAEPPAARPHSARAAHHRGAVALAECGAMFVCSVVLASAHIMRSWHAPAGHTMSAASRHSLPRASAPATSEFQGRSDGRDSVEMRRYSFRGFSCAVRHKPAAPGFEDAPPLLLIHPIGIGLSAWFWDPMLAQWEGSAVWAPDLIGCGESGEWHPSDQGLFIPLDWARQCEELWRQSIRKPVVVVGQGGLAPLAVLLADRAADNWDGRRAVHSIVLTSPPTWREMAEDGDSEQIAKAFRQFSSPLGLLGYRILRSRAFVQLFSNLFLFADRAGVTTLCNHIV